MRTRVVIWGSDKEDQKVLLGISLNADDNKIDLYLIPEKSCTESFFNLMMSTWRDGGTIAMPEETIHRTVELTMSESILPEDIRVERSDLIQRAQMEWHFIVLSSKLYRNYKNELEDLSNKIKRLEQYDSKLFDEMKTFWEGVQKHIYEKNLLRDHADSLKEKSNSLFDELKKLRQSFQKEINQKSKEQLDIVIQKLDQIQERVQSGSALKPLFDQLKTIQTDSRSLKLSREDRGQLMNKLDSAFQSIRDKRENRTSSNPENKGHSSGERIDKRQEGLIKVIHSIEISIERDKKDIEFEQKRIQTTSEQLESQIRVAKIRMIEERIKSKQEKLEDLLKTKANLEKATANIKRKEERNQRKDLERERIKEEEEKIKSKITEEIQAAQELPEEEKVKLTKAAEKIKEAKKSTKPKKSPVVPDVNEIIDPIPNGDQAQPSEEHMNENSTDTLNDNISNVDLNDQLDEA